MKKLITNLKFRTAFAGFTLIELIIVVATIVIIMTLAVPTYSNYSIRSKLGQSMYFVTAVKSAADVVCREGGATTLLSNEQVGYTFKNSKYVKNIVLSGTCDAAMIEVTTQATGARPNPVLTMTGKFAKDADQLIWTCVSSGLNIHAPKTCQS
jgi:type IV pilus assembly protein PilA